MYVLAALISGVPLEWLGVAFCLVLIYLVVRLISHNKDLSNRVYTWGYAIALVSWFISSARDYAGFCEYPASLLGGTVTLPCSFFMYLQHKGLILMSILIVPIVAQFIHKLWQSGLARK